MFHTLMEDMVVHNLILLNYGRWKVVNTSVGQSSCPLLILPTLLTSFLPSNRRKILIRKRMGCCIIFQTSGFQDDVLDLFSRNIWCHFKWFCWSKLNRRSMKLYPVIWAGNARCKDRLGRYGNVNQPEYSK